MVANFDEVDDEAGIRERSLGKPLLEIYNPVLQPWSGDVVAVSEFYEVADGLSASLQHARLLSWLAVVGFTLTFFLVLSAIVLRGSRTIDGQRHILRERIRELSLLLEQNKALRDRVQKASQRTTALKESYLRRIGADLHDGPAQLIAYASLRLDSDKLTNPATPPELIEAEIASIRTSLADAMAEIRTICSGLVLPQIETGTVSEIVRRAVRSHEQRTGTKVELNISGDATALPLSAKICIYRFIQEGLTNAFRHGGGVGQAVSARCSDDEVRIEISDRGTGFDPRDIRPGSLGIAGLRERIESLGGRFELASSRQGTTISMSLGMLEMEKA
jgi:signal transduction histidine kinase